MADDPFALCTWDSDYGTFRSYISCEQKHFASIRYYIAMLIQLLTVFLSAFRTPLKTSLNPIPYSAAQA